MSQTTLEQLKTAIASEIAPYIEPLKNWTPAHTDGALGRKFHDWEKALRDLTPRIAGKLSALALLSKDSNHTHITSSGFGLAMSARLAKVHAALRNEVGLMKDFKKEMARGKSKHNRNVRESTPLRPREDYDAPPAEPRHKTGQSVDARRSITEPRNDRAKVTPGSKPRGDEDDRLRTFLKTAMSPEANRHRGCYACVYLGVDALSTRHDVEKCGRWAEAKALAVKAGFTPAPRGSN